MDLSTSVTIIGWFAQVLLDQGITFAIDHWGGGAAADPDLPGALDSMRAAMNNVCVFLPLAHSIRSENNGLQLLFKDLKAAAYDAEDLLSELDYYRLEQQVEGEDNIKSSSIGNSVIEAAVGFFSQLLTTDDNQASTSSTPPSSHDTKATIVPRIRKVVLRLENTTTALSKVLNLLKPEEFQPNQHVYPVASHRITTSLVPPKETVIGRVSERDQIIKLLLMPAEASVSVIPIVGIGGVGKTTLAKMVYNDPQINKHFDRRLWVCVSHDFDVARLTREMLECLGVEGSDRMTNLNTLQELLMDKLQPVRFLLVLDDVWNESEREKWGSLCAPLRSQKGGSRILMTTRLNTVVSIAAKNIDMLSRCPIKLEGLPEDQYIFLFNTYAFGDENPRDHPSLVEIGKQIAQRLKGSPLAAKTVAGLLRENLDEDHWRSVLNSDIWQLPQSHDDIMPVLQLSYRRLAPHLQQCFTCIVFPKDCEFEKDKLVGMWISHGYIHTKSRGNKSLEEIGSEYFDNLLSRSFIQASYGVKYILHDLLHDLAESVSENEYLKINSKGMKEITSNVRHLYIHSNNLSLLKSYSLRHLRTLIIYGNISDNYTVLKEVLNGLKSIRVLSLNVSVELLWDSVGHLVHLRYLTVKNSDRSMLPDSQCRPYHLQWLVYEGNGYLVLPAATNYLVSLRHFLFRMVWKYWNRGDEIWRMSGIGKLTCLQKLKSFTVGKNEGRKLAELKNLNELRGTLRIASLDNASTKDEALEANLNKKVGIRKLTLACDDGHVTPQIAKEVFEGLCPPPYIKELSLKSYLGVESPTWMMTENRCLSFLQSLELHFCLEWKVLPPLGQLPLLRHLEVYRADAVEEIGSSFYGSCVAKSFPCLETLEFRNMPEWVVWSGVNEFLFPQLYKLAVIDCPKLKRVPMQCLASVEVLQTNCPVLFAELENLTSLKKLILEDCREIQSLPMLPASLVTLEIKDWYQLPSLFTAEVEAETETKLPYLREIDIYACPQLVSVELKRLPSLQKLRIKACERIQSVLLPATLAELDIVYLPMLNAISREHKENLSDLTSLQNIRIMFCYHLPSLPLMPASLQHLCIQNCPELPRERYREGGDEWHKISHVPRVYWE